MQQHKLWDLAGAIPDAQERVRAAAEKEGVSVEAWLQQRLYSDPTRHRPATLRSEQQIPTGEFQPAGAHDPHSQMRTPSLSRNDTAPSTPARRIDETVHAMARLLEANERLQANANWALAGLTSEIDAATREQAEAFDTLKGRFDGLQQTIETGHLRQDIDRINLVLARLSENTQNHLGEAEQKIDALVHRLTSRSGTVALTRDEARQTTIAAAEKLDSVESRLHLTEASAARWPQIEATIEGLSHRVGGIDDIQRTVAELGHWHSQTTNKIVSLSQGLEKIVAGVAAIHEDTRRREVSIENQLDLIADRLGSAEQRLDSHDAKAILVQSRENVVDERLQSLSARADEAEVVSQNTASCLHAIETFAAGLSERIHASEEREQMAEQSIQSLIHRAESLEGRAEIESQNAASCLQAIEALTQNLGERIQIAETRQQTAEQDLQTAHSRVTSLETHAQGVDEDVQAVIARLQAAETRLEAGDAKTMLALGVAHADGIGVARDESEATAWLDRAAQAGEAVAQFRLGARYENGVGVTPSPEQAMRWYSEAARRGNARAMNNLGVAHANGTGVEKDLDEARAGSSRQPSWVWLTHSSISVSSMSVGSASKFHCPKRKIGTWPRPKVAMSMPRFTRRLWHNRCLLRTMFPTANWRPRMIRKIYRPTKRLRNPIYLRKTNPIWEWLQRTKACCRLI